MVGSGDWFVLNQVGTVGRIGVDQAEDYAARRGLDLAGVERWLATQNDPALDVQFARSQRMRKVFRSLILGLVFVEAIVILSFVIAYSLLGKV